MTERGNREGKRLWSSGKKKPVILVKPQSKGNKSSYSQQLQQLFPKQQPPAHLKLILAHLEFHQGISCFDNESSAFVVGIIGKAGVGKTTIYNKLGGIQNFKNTTGINMTRTNEGILLLDSQPLKLDQKNRKHDTLDTLLTLFLLSVCHVVIIVTDQKMDTELVKFIKKLGAYSHASKTLNPELLFVMTKCPHFVFSSRYTQKMSKLIQDELLDFNLCTSISPQQYFTFSHQGFDLDDHDDSSDDAIATHYNLENHQTYLYAIPNERLDFLENNPDIFEHVWEMNVTFLTALEDLCSKVKSILRAPLPEAKGSLATPISEKEWYKFAESTWNYLRSNK